MEPMELMKSSVKNPVHFKDKNDGVLEMLFSFIANISVL